MVMSWLWDSMNPEISDTRTFFTSTKAIWDSIQRTYSKARDAAQVYEIKVKMSATKQGNKSITEVIEMKCPDGAVVLKNFIEKDRVYDFLAGLNLEFDQVRIQILGREKIPSLEEAISLIQGEESRRGIMLKPQTLENSALITRSEQPQMLERGEVDLHTKESCWKLNGKPPSREWGNRGGQQRSQSQAHLTEQTSQDEKQEKGGLNSEEMEKLRGLIGSLEKPSGACSLALSGLGDIYVTPTLILKDVHVPKLSATLF
ncbi:uncharacterized protein LOC112092593 [Morus notabilis]|uniref:uncharacterized protein LOC112092593 n=1 Tax=Morus notabilis TaxID=981085 RepID=UPI000CED2F44|nr:uncharacterized protein LOC112092593 [Morus notabilis]